MLKLFFCKWFFCLFILKVIVGYKENMINIFDRDLTFDHNKILYWKFAYERIFMVRSTVSKFMNLGVTCG